MYKGRKKESIIEVETQDPYTQIHKHGGKMFTILLYIPLRRLFPAQYADVNNLLSHELC